MSLSEISNNICEVLKERVSNTMYGTFIISWILWNWKIFYITFFVDQKIIFDQFHILKIDYILQNYRIDSTLQLVGSIIHIIVAPLISTYIIIWQLSKLDLIVFNKNLKNLQAKEKAENKAKEEALDRKTSVLTKTDNLLEIEKKIEEKISGNEEWQNEFDKVSKEAFFIGAFVSLKNTLYTKRGHISSIKSTDSYVPANDLAYLHTNNFIEFTNEHKNQIEITEKGKFFLNKFIISNQSFDIPF
jgi:hypothetical protein